jgi:hypothetical protein
VRIYGEYYGEAGGEDAAVYDGEGAGGGLVVVAVVLAALLGCVVRGPGAECLRVDGMDD